MKPTPSKKMKEYDRDLFYRRMSEKPPVNPEDEPVVGLVEWVDLLSKKLNQVD